MGERDLNREITSCKPNMSIRSIHRKLDVQNDYVPALSPETIIFPISASAFPSLILRITS